MQRYLYVIFSLVVLVGVGIVIASILFFAPSRDTSPTALVDTARDATGNVASSSSTVAVSKTSSSQKKVWILDNNLGKGSDDGLVLDAQDIFLHPEKWSSARNYLGVYFFRVNQIERENPPFDFYTDDYLRDKLIPILKNSNVSIGLSVWGPLYAQCTFKTGQYAGQKLGDVRRAQEKAFIDRITSLGGTVSYISMLSVLSKNPPAGKYDNCDSYALVKGSISTSSVQQRTQDIIDYAKYIKGLYPSMKIGELDSLIRFPQWRDGSGYLIAKSMLDSQGVHLDFWVLDLPYEIPHNQIRGITYADIVRAETIIKNELRSDFVLLTVSRISDPDADVGNSTIEAGQTAASQAYINTKRFLDESYAAGLRPDYFYSDLYFPEPQYSLPDNDPTIFSQMRQVKMIGDFIANHPTL